MNDRLFVGNLSWNTDDHSLRQAFEAFGEVTDAKVITDRDTGRSRGFGFVTFANADDARVAMQDMDGQSLDGRNVRVNEANARGGSRGGRDRGPRDGGGNYGSDRDRRGDGGRGGQRPPRRRGSRDDRWGGGGDSW